MSSEELLEALVATLERIRRLVPTAEEAWNADERTTLAVERLWIEAGTTAEEYRRAAHIDPGIDPWAELYEYRNRLAHALPGDIDPERVWQDSTADIGRLLADLRADPSALEG